MQDTSQTSNIIVYLGHGYQRNFVAIVNATIRLQAGGLDLTQEDQFKTALMEAITEWVLSSENGQRAWEDACGEFQVCDLSNALPSPDLDKILARRGIEQISITIPEFAELWDCETNLIDESRVENLA